MNRARDMIRVAGRASRFMQASDREAVVRYLHRLIEPDGGFRGRAPGSDLYYTIFGLSCLTALERPLADAEVRRYLEPFGHGATLDFVHQAAAVRCWSLTSDPGRVSQSRGLLQRMERRRTTDGGYDLLTEGGEQGSVYGAFLAWLAYEEAGAQMPRPHALVSSLRTLAAADGGFANSVSMPGSTTTATAAAILLQYWVDGSVDTAALQALATCAHRNGGFRASAQAPAPDLLSTATALYAIKAVGRSPEPIDPHLAFIELLWEDDGGFRGHVADSLTDCEYTFYALLALGCLHDD